MRLADKAMSYEALQELIDSLALKPEQGVVISGTGGIRKIRWRQAKITRGKVAAFVCCTITRKKCLCCSLHFIESPTKKT